MLFKAEIPDGITREDYVGAVERVRECGTPIVLGCSPEGPEPSRP